MRNRRTTQPTYSVPATPACCTTLPQRLASALTKTTQDLLTDPQTSGGLLVSCDADSADEVLRLFREQGFEHAAVIGHIEAGAPGLTVQP